MYKKIILMFILILSSGVTFAEDGYVSPETYAVNESELLDYMSVPTQNTKPQKVRKLRQYKGETISESIFMYNAKEFLQKQHQRMGNSHHGELHEIKLNAKYKNNPELAPADYVNQKK